MANAYDLISLFKHATGNTLQTDIEVTADLDFSSSALTLPLGAFSNGTCVAFSGVFQGNGHSIKGLKMDNTGNSLYDDAGLFCSLKDATVENLVIDSSCSFTGDSAGALSVSVNGSLTVKSTTNNAAVNGKWRVGGFIGTLEYMQEGVSLTLENCTNEGNMTAAGEVGGLIGYIGYNNNAVVKMNNCHCHGFITGEGQCGVGGLIGRVFSNTAITILLLNNSNNGNVKGSTENIGGFIGLIDYDGANIQIMNCANFGNVSG